MSTTLIETLNKSVLSTASARTLLQEAKADETFPWLKDITDISLDEFVNAHLKTLGVRPDFYDPGDVDTHFEALGSLIQRSLDRSTDIWDLESKALLTAFDFLLAEALDGPEYSLQTRLLRAAHSQVFSQKEAKAAAFPDLDARQERVKANRNLRLLAHASSGSSLNYGERVKLARTLLAIDVRSLYERVQAIRRGLANSFGISLPDLPVFLPHNERMARFSTWFRNAVDRVESSEATETVSDVVLFLGQDSLFQGGVLALQSLLQSRASTVIDFTLKAEHLSSGKSVARLLAMGVAPAFSDGDGIWNEIAARRGKATLESTPVADAEHFLFVDNYLQRKRRQIAFSISVQPPTQTTLLDGQVVSWPRKLVKLPPASPWIGTLGRDSAVFVSDQQLRGINPSGDWSLTIDGRAMEPPRPVSKGEFGTRWAREADQNALEKLFDVVLILRIAIRDRV